MAVFGGGHLVLDCDDELHQAQAHPQRLGSPLPKPLGNFGALSAPRSHSGRSGACFANADFRPAVWATAAFLAVAVAYFVLYSRTRFVAQAPEERVALEGVIG